VRAAGRLETPDELRTQLASTLDSVVQLRDRAKRLRGPAREEIAGALVDLDRAMLVAARTACGAELAEVERAAEAELASYRARLAPAVWQASVDASVDRLLRDRFGLPTLDPSRL
jgi:hypothetical protein